MSEGTATAPAESVPVVEPPFLIQSNNRKEKKKGREQSNQSCDPWKPGEKSNSGQPRNRNHAGRRCLWPLRLPDSTATSAPRSALLVLRRQERELTTTAMDAATSRQLTRGWIVPTQLFFVLRHVFFIHCFRAYAMRVSRLMMVYSDNRLDAT